MRRFLPLLLALALVPAACRQQPEGELKVVVIGAKPKLADPYQGPLSAPDAVLVQNVAQGLVRFDGAGNIVPGLAERWNVSDDGLSYIFRIASAQWPDGRKIGAQQVARLLKRQLVPRSRNGLKDALGAVEDIVAMTDRVIEIRLIAARPNLLPLLAQPEFAIQRGDYGTGPFRFAPAAGSSEVLSLSRDIVSGDDAETAREEVLLSAADANAAVSDFAAGDLDLVLGGRFADVAFAQKAKLPRGTLRFDPASGLFGLIPVRRGGPLDRPEVRAVLSQAIDRDRLIATLGVPNLAARATLLEPGLDGTPAPAAPDWTATSLADRLPALQAEVDRRFSAGPKPTVRLALPQGPGADLVLRQLIQDWGALGFTVEQAPTPASADFALIDEVAPSSSPAWFVRRFRCDLVPVCDPNIDELLESARNAQAPQQRYALLSQAAAKVDEQQLFLPITAPIRWSLVSRRIQGFGGNRYARHTLTDLERRPGSGD